MACFVNKYDFVKNVRKTFFVVSLPLIALKFSNKKELLVTLRISFNVIQGLWLLNGHGDVQLGKSQSVGRSIGWESDESGPPLHLGRSVGRSISWESN